MLTYSKQLDLRCDVDVFVAGGGPSGIAAAVTAARNGKSVFVAEALGCFGGGGTSMLVPSFCAFRNGEAFLAGGIGYEICMSYYGNCDHADGYWPLHAERLKTLYDGMVRQSGAKFTFFTTLLDVVTDAPDHVDYVVCGAKSGLFAVRAKYYLDCTGDADLCARAGAKYELGDDEGLCMGSTLCSTWANIDWSQVLPRDDRGLEDAIRDGVFRTPDRHLPGMFPIQWTKGGESVAPEGMFPVNGTLGGGNIGHVFGVNGTDEGSLTEAMLEGRRYMLEYERYYKEYLKGFENMELAATAPYPGVRESRRVTGDYVLDLDDFIARRHFDDEIGMYSYPVDIHVAKPGRDDYARFEKEFETLRYQPGESYGIPFRTLTPAGLSNVLVAGRSISTDRAMQASVRVMPCCYITGQAIGMAAAMDPGDVHETDVPELQKRLRDMGATLL